MLRDPKDVAKEVRQASMAGWETQTGEGIIRARDREVIAEAKLVVSECAYVGFPEMILRKVALDALDAILKEKE